MDVMLVPTNLYIWVERGTVRVKCLAHEHNTMFTARTQTCTAPSGGEHSNHEGNVPTTACMSPNIKGKSG